MLTKFSVSNYKGFNEKFVFDLSNTNNYAFQKECVKNGIVNNALIYGHNGVGKSNLAYALDDITIHLSDNINLERRFDNYLNAASKESYASFEYEFLFGKNSVYYKYKKIDQKTFVYEELKINNKSVLRINRKESEEAFIDLKGTENLKKNIHRNDLSLVKYIKINALLEENQENLVLQKFYDFVESMFFFKSVDEKNYFGFFKGDLQKKIIENKLIKELENFLNNGGIECKITKLQKLDKSILAFKFDKNSIPFFEIASTGTLVLTYFFYWIRYFFETYKKPSFIFMDEFDAYYHHELSAKIVEELKKSNVQFILTSHNTSVITNNLLRPDCYFLMKKDSIKSLAKSTHKELREAHNIEKMYKAGSFNG